MSNSNKRKQEIHISIKETAEKLRILADELEKGSLNINGEEFSINPDTSVKISTKSKEGRLSYKIKFDLSNRAIEKKGKPLKKSEVAMQQTNSEQKDSEPTSSKDQTIEDYKDLKKRMSIDYKAIKNSCVKENAIPESILIDRFCRDAQAMCNYPDKGEEFYKTFLEQSNQLYTAYKKSDLEAISAAIILLGNQRKQCHDKYK